MLERKRSAMSRCLSMAVDNKELPRNAQGKVTVEIVISPSGTADQVKIVRATVQSKMLEDCVIGHIKEIAFPQLPAPFETSFTYGFEAM
jgi:outer membrane biosynthesis protein TonB